MSVLEQLYAGLLPELILLDLDGTLIDSVPDLFSAVNVMLAELDRPAVTLGQVRQWVGNGASTLVLRALARHSNASLQMDAIDSTLHTVALDKFMSAYRDCCCQQTVLYPGVVEALTRWQAAGIKMACVTNKPIEFTQTILAKQQLTEFMSLVLGGDSLTEKKPSPVPLHYAIDHCGVSKQYTLMIGDSQADIGAARAAQIPVVCVSYGYNHGKDIRLERPDFVVDSLLQI